MVGYARVSTLEQDPALQHDALTAAGAVRIFTDVASGATAARPQLTACLVYLRAGDTLAVWRIDRLGRSVADLTAIGNTLAQRGIQFRSLTEVIDTATVGGELVFHVFAAVAQMERRLISERTRAGLHAARARGRRGGRPTVMSPDRIATAERMRARGKTLVQIAAALGSAAPRWCGRWPRRSGGSPSRRPALLPQPMTRPARRSWSRHRRRGVGDRHPGLLPVGTPLPLRGGAVTIEPSAAARRPSNAADGGTRLRRCLPWR